MLFMLSDQLNPIKHPYSFEHWYMFYFYDVQLWERKLGPEQVSVYSNLAPSQGRSSLSSLGSTVSSIQNTDMQVLEVVNRVAELAKVLFLFSCATFLHTAEHKHKHTRTCTGVLVSPGQFFAYTVQTRTIQPDTGANKTEDPVVRGLAALQPGAQQRVQPLPSAGPGRYCAQ
jgi:hypothetical protein